MDLHDKKTTPAPLSGETQGAPQSPPPTDANSVLALPERDSEGAHIIAGLIGSPLAREGIPDNIRLVLEASIRAGDAHGMHDFGMLAKSAADQHAKKDPESDKK
jgi:hypothetical protein